MAPRYACRDYDADAAEGGWQGGLLTGLLVDTLEELVFVSAGLWIKSNFFAVQKSVSLVDLEQFAKY